MARRAFCQSSQTLSASYLRRLWACAKSRRFNCKVPSATCLLNSLSLQIRRCARARSLEEVVYGLSQFIQFSFYAMAFWYGGKLIEDGEINFLEFMKSPLALAFAAFGAGQAATFAGDQAKANAAKSRIFRLMDTIPPIDLKPWDDSGRVRQIDGTIIPADKLKGRIELSGIKFAYPTRRARRPFSTALSPLSLASQSRSSVNRDRASRPLFNSWRGFTIRPMQLSTRHLLLKGQEVTASLSTGSMCVRSIVKLFARLWVLLVKSPCSFTAPYAGKHRLGKSGATEEEIIAAAKRQMRTISSWTLAGTTRTLALEAGRFQEVKSSASQLLVPLSRTPRSCSSTKQRLLWTTKAKRSSRHLWIS